MSNKKNKYIKAEVLDKKETKEEKKINEKIQFSSDIESLKKEIFKKGIYYILPFLGLSLLFLVVLIFIIFILFDNPFDYIFTTIILFFVFRFIWKVFKSFK